MPLVVPAELKKISPYIRRAEELDKDQSSAESRIVAFYMRQYAVHQGIPIAGSSAAAKTCLQEILDDLEKEKPTMSNFTFDEAGFLCRQFSDKVFNRADEEDRVGQANKNTAKSFYAAASFLQILEQFYKDDDDEETRDEDRKRIVYSKWKSTEILKAIKEGREPMPGGYGEDTMDQEQDKEEAAADTNELPIPMAPSVDLNPPQSPAVDPDPIPKPAPLPEEESKPEPESEDEEIEVTLGPPPPAYPGEASPLQPDRPPVRFDLPPAMPVSPSEGKKKGMGGMFGLMKKSKPTGGKPSKAAIADATELTRFALTALEDKDGELAIERLSQALEALSQ